MNCRRRVCLQRRRTTTISISNNQDLQALLDSGDTKAFLAGAVKSKKNILISGATGSGKTTLSKALIAEIPESERIITIEDTAELVVPQPNRVALFYPKDGPNDAIGRVQDRTQRLAGKRAAHAPGPDFAARVA